MIFREQAELRRTEWRKLGVAFAAGIVVLLLTVAVRWVLGR
jgi:hypothetical protein